MRARARPKPAGLGIGIPDGMLRDFAVAKLVILRVRARARPKPAGLGIVAPAKQSTASERKPQVAASAEDER